MRRTYQFEAIINEQGMIALPRFRSNLNQHRVKLTLIDSPESPLNAINLLSKLTETYQHLDEADLDVAEIYNRRMNDHGGRSIIFD
ncbi:MAG: hypothetical protein BWK78_04805 [Thiotrichaceae bacterium IS1]|nr:MAG: hypothetical protein BWK78_04805 [Thiotrichaceae bacterium IS1]